MERQLLGPASVRTRAIPNVAGLGGAIAGLIAGIVMIVLSPLLSYLTNVDLWEPPKMIAAVVYGRDVVLTPGFVLGPVLTGTLLHLVMSTVLGLIFGFLYNRVFHLTTAFGLPVQIGLVYGVLIWMVNYFLILPIFNPTLYESYQAPFVAQHLVYGVVLGIAYMLVRQLPYRYDSTEERRRA